jgi:hypothetical protein
MEQRRSTSGGLLPLCLLLLDARTAESRAAIEIFLAGKPAALPLACELGGLKSTCGDFE